MIPKHQRHLANVRNLLVIAAFFTSSFLPAQQVNSPADDSEVIEMSPFVIESGDEQGYLATSTLAGTRIRTDLKDLGASISVATKQLMEDIGADDMGTLMSYMANGEVGGVNGNFSGVGAGLNDEISGKDGDADASRFVERDQRTDPQLNQRIRGIGRAQLTRDLFLTDIPLDSYNTDRVTISRGPNSLLFGIGEPGGVIDNSLARAGLHDSHGKFKLKLDNFGSIRTELDYNKVIMQDRLAVRVALMNDEKKFQQDQAWLQTERAYLAADWVVAENRQSRILGATKISFNGELGRNLGSPPETVPPTMAFDSWFNPLPAGIEQYTGVAADSRAVHPDEGGTWQYQATYNPFARTRDRELNTVSRQTLFRLIGGVYNQPNATAPSLGYTDPVSGSEVSGIMGVFRWGGHSMDQLGLANTPGVLDAGLSPNQSQRNYTWFAANSVYSEPYAIGFAAPTLNNTDIFDYRNNVFSGGIDHLEREWGASNFSVEQNLFNNKASIQLSYDNQFYSTDQDFLFSGSSGTSRTGPYDIYVDLAEYLPDGQPNPNVGRAFTRAVIPKTSHKKSERETIRLTVFGELDLSRSDGWLSWLGKHKFTGLYSDHKHDIYRNQHRDIWGFTPEIDIGEALDAAEFSHFRRPADMIVYVSDDLRGLSSINDVRISPVGITRPQPGQDFEILLQNFSDAFRGPQYVTVPTYRYLHVEKVNQSNIESQAIAWQSYLLSNHVVGLVGYRTDSVTDYGMADDKEVGYFPRNAAGEWKEDYTRLTAEPSFEQSGDTVTWSAVGRYPESWLGELPFGMDLQVHIANSENFNPVGLRNNILGGVIDNPTGKTKEIGALVSLMDSKFNLRFNWFKTELTGIDAPPRVNIMSNALKYINTYKDAELEGIPFSYALEAYSPNPANHPIQSYDQFYTAMLDTVPQTLLDIQQPFWRDSNGDGIDDSMNTVGDIDNLRSTRDRVAEGYEIEVIINPTNNWRIMGSLSQQETINDNSAGLMAKYVEEYISALDSYRPEELVLDPTGQQIERPLNEKFISESLAPIRQTKALDGTVSNEQREWRATALTNYSFNEGRLAGFSIGGAVRWESEAATGYVYGVEPTTGVPVPDVSRPFFDDGVFSGDLWVGYHRKIYNDKVDWRIQLNVRNAIGERDDIPVVTNPDGRRVVFRIPNPRTFTLTNTFRF